MIKEDIYLKDEPLDRHTAFKIGGPARLWVEPDSIDSLKGLLNMFSERNQEYRIIGNGSNLLVSDKGIDCAVIKLGSFNKLYLEGNTITAESGVNLGQLLNCAIKNRLAGLEFLSGIPGTVGGAVKTNAGAYGKEISDVLMEITVIDKDGAHQSIVREEIEFRYRSSNINSGLIILSAKFCLTPCSEKEIMDTIDNIMQNRRKIYPLGFPNAGSVFKNPRNYSAGEIIDQLGLKGTVRGKAMISKKHGNIIINQGGAGFEDVLELIRYVKDTVYKEKGIELELEIELW